MGVYKRHGLSKRIERNSWLNMRTRCNNKNNANYVYYGGRGIKVCDRWQNSFEDFYNDMGERPSPEYTLERIDNEGNYEPGNCRWATRQEQSTNKRLYKGTVSGISGITYRPDQKRWILALKVSGKTKHIGSFETLTEAAQAHRKLAF